MTQPSFGPLIQTVPRSFRLSNWGQETDITGLIDATARDAQSGMTINNPNRPTILRAGLIVAIVTATGKWKEFDASDVDGTQTAAGILMQDIDLLDPLGAARDTGAVIATVGEFDGNKLICEAAELAGAKVLFLAAGSHIVVRS